MTNEEKLRAYAGRVNLLSEDVEYILSLLREAKLEAYEEAAQIVERKQSVQATRHENRFLGDDAVETIRVWIPARTADEAAAEIRALKESLAPAEVASS